MVFAKKHHLHKIPAATLLLNTDHVVRNYIDDKAEVVSLYGLVLYLWSIHHMYANNDRGGNNGAGYGNH